MPLFWLPSGTFCGTFKAPIISLDIGWLFLATGTALSIRDWMGPSIGAGWRYLRTVRP